MSLLFTSPHSCPSSLFSPPNPIPKQTHFHSPTSLSIPIFRPTRPLLSLKHLPHSSLSDEEPEPPSGLTDEWGDLADPEPESAYTRLAASDPPRDDDEWGPSGPLKAQNDAPPAAAADDVAVAVAAEENGSEKILELKRCLVDSVYGTEMGFRAKLEERAEIIELVNQLEALNPTPSPTQTPGLLDGNWVLLFTGFSELLPLLAVGSTPLLKVTKISQSIDTSSSTIVNSTTLSSPFSTFSFSATATFEVRTPSRIQVQFKEGTFQAPEIKSSVDLPGEVDVLGQKISLSPLQQTLNPIQEAVANISRVIAGQPPLKVPIPGERTSSWLLTTYLDEDFRISRGDGGLFVLAKEGSSLLYQ